MLLSVMQKCMIILLKDNDSRNSEAPFPPVYSEERWNSSRFIALDEYITAAHHNPTEPTFSDRIILIRQERGFVILPNLPFPKLRNLLQHSAKYPLQL